ncbi:hypothetical protein NC652_004824 [Populus alba x Populus x berolinensis]|nr:hypothetical protein NC652_004824 [Populus alba x Populus x berolinensis]
MLIPSVVDKVIEDTHCDQWKTDEFQNFFSKLWESSLNTRLYVIMKPTVSTLDLDLSNFWTSDRSVVDEMLSNGNMIGYGWLPRKEECKRSLFMLQHALLHLFSFFLSYNGYFLLIIGDRLQVIDLRKGTHISVRSGKAEQRKPQTHQSAPSYR